MSLRRLFAFVEVKPQWRYYANYGSSQLSRYDRWRILWVESWRLQMRLPFCLNALCRLALLAAAITASAQDIFVTPIPGVPFSGIVNVERLLIQPDGSIVNLKTIRNIGRDSRGRIHNESRALVPVLDTKRPPVVSIHLYDPQTRVSTMLNPQDRTFRTKTVNRPPETVPPAFLDASPTGDSLPQNEFTKKEDLGIRDIEGLSAHGVRESQTIPDESSGRNKEIVITDEYWYSDDLRINLKIKHSDPRTGTVTITVAQITRTEPDLVLFEIPDGYRKVGTNQ